MVNEKTASSPGVTKDEQRWFHAMKVVADPTLSDRHRAAAINRIKEMLPESNSLKRIKTSRLLDTVLPPWAERVYLVNGRGVERQVTRPPVSLADLW